jgi:hypothetical protein
MGGFMLFKLPSTLQAAHNDTKLERKNHPARLRYATAATSQEYLGSLRARRVPSLAKIILLLQRFLVAKLLEMTILKVFSLSEPRGGEF